MKKILFLLCIIVIAAHANSLLEQKRLQKAQNIYKTLCEESVFERNDFTSFEDFSNKLACGEITLKQKELLWEYYQKVLQTKTPLTKMQTIEVPKGAKCPVCGMFVHKYPKWAAAMVLQDGAIEYFDGVKDMMKYYLFDHEFGFKKESIAELFVSDYYTLEKIEAKKAWFVIGSNVYGPMGLELIPFKRKEDAMHFLEHHFGKKLLKFGEINEAIINSLD